MYLKRLELQGFKSFADKTVLDFKDGVTAVVGPNGSGKSNISDAIRWVLGEMSAKSLRGSNMQDVIFSGTQSRKQLNFAEVSLVLDNSDGIFPIEFDEVVVTRRVFRSGESVYQINRANCRLKDIHELFMDTGLGRDGYSIIGQGNVAQILSTKAEDRRSLFEEAAGVSKYKHRKEEACRKLEHTNENLVRLTDIIAELENQVGPLEKQSEKARKYLVLYEQFKKLDINLTLLNIEKNTEKKKKADELYKNVSDELNDVRSEAGAAEKELTDLYEQSKQCDEEQSQKNESLRENENKKNLVQGEISVAQTQISNNRDLTVRIDNEIQASQDKNKQRKEDIENSRSLREEKQQTVGELEKELETVDGQNTQIDNLHTEKKNLLENKKNDVFEIERDASSKREKMNGIDALRKSFLERKSDVEAELSGHSEGVESTKEEIRTTNENIIALTEKRDKMNTRIETQRNILRENNEKAANLSNQISAMRVDFNSKKSKKRMLEDMENDYEGFARSVKAVLKAPELKRIAIMGTLASLIEVKNEYVTAVETALGGAMQNIVVESEEDAKQAIAYLRNAKVGRATFLPVSSVRGKLIENRDEIARCDGFIGIASELVEYDKKYDGIIKSLLGRVAVFDNIDNGIKVSRKFGYRFRTVTLAGDVLNAGGSMSGGSTSKTGGFLSRANDIKQLSHDINQLDRMLSEKNNELEKVQADIKGASSQLDLYMPMQREYENELIKLNSGLSHLEESLNASGNTRRQLTNELDEINRNLEETGSNIAMLINSVREAENSAKAIREEIDRLSEEVLAIEEQQKSQNDQKVQAVLKLRDLHNEISGAKKDEEKLETDIKAELEKIEEKNKEKQDIYAENEKLQSSINEKMSLIGSIEEYSNELENQIKALDEQKRSITDKQKKIQDSNKGITDRLVQLQKELSRAENMQTNLETDREKMINRIWDEYELTISSAEEIREDVENEKQASEDLANLKNQIRALGSVNIDSIEEYQSVKERFELMTAQKKDLDDSKEELNKIIDSMQELMEENFVRQFKEIQESFSGSFQDLFGGGSGKVYLTDPDNALESGIEIEVQLPGKGLQNISLYSGGERSFIAIALLFAILNVKPTPFCILDEIDAALDDVNVSRFATYLHNYLERSQFIVITHRRGTMEAANILYGVTMQEKGVSKLLSLQIDDVDLSMAQ